LATKTLLSRDAVIRTATVEIKALTLGGRQITQSVFKQIPDEMLVNPETLELRGFPWGQVNYRWGDCSDRGQAHLHVIWQSGPVLRRACIDPDPAHQPGVCLASGRLRRHVEAIHRAAFLWLSTQKKPTYHGDYFTNMSIDGWSCTLSPDEAVRVRHRWDFPQLSGYVAKLDGLSHGALIALYEGWPASLDGPDSEDGFQPSAASFREILARADAEIARRRRAWAVRYEELARLDQLFIAV
jgi:hypothetical protein